MFTSTPRATELLASSTMSNLVEEIANRYPDRIVIFDSPPIIGVSDASVLASIADSTILVIQHRRNPESMVLRARQIIAGLKVPIDGVILNQVPTGTGEDYGYYTSNYAYYSDGSGKRSSGKSTPKGGSRPPGGDRLELKE